MPIRGKAAQDLAANVRQLSRVACQGVDPIAFWHSLGFTTAHELIRHGHAFSLFQADHAIQVSLAAHKSNCHMICVGVCIVMCSQAWHRSALFQSDHAIQVSPAAHRNNCHMICIGIALYSVAKPGIPLLCFSQIMPYRSALQCTEPIAT